MPGVEQPSVIIPVRLPVEHRTRLREICRREDRTIANLIRRIVRLYLQHPERFEDLPQPEPVAPA